MTERSLTASAAAVAILLALSACGSTDQAAQNTTPANAPIASASAPASPEPHNQADVTFAQRMIPHHQQAIEMSDILLGKQGIDLRVVGLANQIKGAQAPEIQQMQGWLSQWGQPSAPTSPGRMGDMPGDGDMPGMSDGQGMMSEQDMAALRSAQGTEASRLFLTQMITHHDGAITMAQAEIESGQYPPAVAVARAIVSTQQQEIDQMRGILDTL